MHNFASKKLHMLTTFQMKNEDWEGGVEAEVFHLGI